MFSFNSEEVSTEAQFEFWFFYYLATCTWSNGNGILGFRGSIGTQTGKVGYEDTLIAKFNHTTDVHIN